MEAWGLISMFRNEVAAQKYYFAARLHFRYFEHFLFSKLQHQVHFEENIAFVTELHVLIVSVKFHIFRSKAVGH